MSGRVTWAIGLRVLWQIRRDPRTIALLLVVPVALLVLLKYVFAGEPAVFKKIGVPLCGLFPFIVMFLITSIAMLRERTSGTLERLMTLPHDPARPARRLRDRVRVPGGDPGRGRQPRRVPRCSDWTPRTAPGSLRCWRSGTRCSAWRSACS